MKIDLKQRGQRGCAPVQMWPLVRDKEDAEDGGTNKNERKKGVWEKNEPKK